MCERATDRVASRRRGRPRQRPSTRRPSRPPPATRRLRCAADTTRTSGQAHAEQARAQPRADARGRAEGHLEQHGHKVRLRLHLDAHAGAFRGGGRGVRGDFCHSKGDGVKKNLWASSLSKRVDFENQNSKLSDGVTADEGAEHGSRARGGAQGRGHLPPDSVRRGATRPGFAHVGLAAGPSARAGCIANQILLRSLDRRHRAAAAGPAEGARPAQGSLARHGHPRRHRRWSVLSRVPADAHPPAGQRKETWGVPTLPHRDASLALLQCASRGAQSLALTICLLHAPAAASFCPARCAPAPTPSSPRARNTSRDAPRGQAREGA